MNNLEFLKNEILNKTLEMINPIFFYLNYDEIVKDIDIIFYKSFFPDLCDLNELELIYHYYKFGIFENRLAKETSFYRLYPSFNLSEYKLIYFSHLKRKN